MKIPKSVTLLGKTILVVEGTKKMRKKREGGMANFVAGTIAISTHCQDEEYPRQEQEHTFFHELVHHCLNAMGRQDLNGDEAFVDLLGGMLHQALGPHMQ